MALRRILALLAVVLLAACGKPAAPYHGGVVETLAVTDQQVGQGETAKRGDTVEVNYTGWLYEQSAKDHHGAKFDSSFDHGAPLSFVLGSGQVISGWDQGVTGMRVGGKRSVVIPPTLGYGSRGAGNAIPPNAALVFDITLNKVTPP